MQLKRIWLTLSVFVISQMKSKQKIIARQHNSPPKQTTVIDGCTVSFKETLQNMGLICGSRNVQPLQLLSIKVKFAADYRNRRPTFHVTQQKVRRFSVRVHQLQMTFVLAKHGVTL
jgi:hypothetical protein